MNSQTKNWFKIERLPGNVVAFTEDKHEQLVSSFLIIGEEKALLFDTGLGVCDIKEAVESVYEGEIIVVNSHFHFDHIGNNWRFDKVYGRVDQYSKRVSEEGISNEKIASQFQDKCFIGGKPEGFDKDKYMIRPYNLVPLEEGQIFDLGGRKIKVLFAEGHSQDSVVLYDEEKGILFTGDFFYLGGLFVFFNDPIYGVSSLDDYLTSARRLAGACPDVKTIYPSHNQLVVQGGKLKELKEALEEVTAGVREPDIVVDDVDPYTGERIKLGRYNFDSFGIVIKTK